jgi:hypothetical protein
MMTMNTIRKAVMGSMMLTLLVIVSKSASAALDIEKKIGEFGSPVEWRTECVKWASGNWPWGGGWKTCVGHKYQNLQHSFILVAKGPNADQAAAQVLQEAIGAAVAAAVGTGILTPSPEPTARIAAALVAGKQAFVGYLAGRGFERLVSQYDLRIDHRTHW